MFKILDKFILGPKIHCINVLAPLISAKAQAGQFVMVRVNEKGERIPLTISDFDRENGSITIVFQEAGRTTQLLGSMEKGESIPDVLGPQGNPTEAGRFGNACVIGGGIGVAPVYILARKLKEEGNNVTAILGYKSKEYVFWEDKIRSVSDQVLISTNDGSYGEKGLVTDLLNKLISGGQKIDRVFAIGPTVMMRAVAEVTRENKIKTIVSLNTLMVCGMGMCGACRVNIGAKVRFACMDGPDFDGHQVDFEELTQRLTTYKNEESG
jgi:ferredoxin--NADP+ reductase